jgi:hypothetical protein
MNIQESAKKLKKFFALNEVDKIAKKTGFIQRERKITGSGFLKSMLFASIENSFMSLEFIKDNKL